MPKQFTTTNEKRAAIRNHSCHKTAYSLIRTSKYLLCLIINHNLNKTRLAARYSVSWISDYEKYRVQGNEDGCPCTLLAVFFGGG